MEQKILVYHRCCSCDQIHPVQVDGGEETAYVCPDCGKEGWSKQWPDSSIRRVIQIVLGLSPQDADYERISCLLLSACLEDMMREQLTTMALEGTIWDAVSLILDPLLDAYRGRQRQMQLFRNIGYGSFSKNCSEVGFPDYPRQWGSIADQRNYYAHSTGEPCKPLTDVNFRDFIVHTMAVFAYLHNRYNVETTAYSAAVDLELRACLKEIEEEDCEQEN